jgi:hypothetical protein
LLDDTRARIGDAASMGDINEYSRGWYDGFNAESRTSAPDGFEHPEPTDHDLGHRHGYDTGQKFASERRMEVTPRIYAEPSTSRTRSKIGHPASRHHSISSMAALDAPYDLERRNDDGQRER